MNPTKTSRTRTFKSAARQSKTSRPHRNSANPENIQALIEATLKLLASPNAVNRNPVVSYALAYQLLPRARDLTPDRVAEFEKAMLDLETANPGIAGPGSSRSRRGAESGPRKRRSRDTQFLVDGTSSRRNRRRAIRPGPPVAGADRRPSGSRTDRSANRLRRSRLRDREQKRSGHRDGESAETGDQAESALYLHDLHEPEPRRRAYNCSLWLPRTSHRSPRSSAYACSLPWQPAWSVRTPKPHSAC